MAMKSTLHRSVPRLGSFVSTPRAKSWKSPCRQCLAEQWTLSAALGSPRRRHISYLQRQAKYFSAASPLPTQVRGHQDVNSGPGRGPDTKKDKKSTRKRRAIQVAAAGGTLGVALFGFTDDIKHFYAGAQRSARVVSTLAVCINE